MVFEKENFSLSAKLEERPLPQGNKQLLQWAQKAYGAVTSFTELKISKNVYIKVGEGKFCKISLLTVFPQKEDNPGKKSRQP